MFEIDKMLADVWNVSAAPTVMYLSGENLRSVYGAAGLAPPEDLDDAALYELSAGGIKMLGNL